MDEKRTRTKPFRRVPVKSQELVLGDAGYWSTAGVEFVRSRGAHVLVRVNPQTFVAYWPAGRRVELLRRLRTIRHAGQMGDWRVVLHGENGIIEGRICAIRKSEYAIQLFKSAALSSALQPAPFQDFYLDLLAKGMKPEMARLTLARKIAAITLTLWKKGACFDVSYVKSQAA
jgi:hypothetical protein